MRTQPPRDTLEDMSDCENPQLDAAWLASLDASWWIAGGAARDWLRDALERCEPGHAWLSAF